MTRRKDLLSAGTRQPQVSTSDPPLRAPYAFVPLSEHILPSPVDGRLNLGRPLAQSICGTLKVRWTAETPLLVGGANDENNKPFAINGTYAIPGASLKGMIRSVLEIAAFGRLTFYDDYVGYTRNTDGLRWHRTVPPEKRQGLEGRSGDAHPQRGGWLLRRWNGDRWEFRLVRADTRVFEIDRLVKILPGKVDRQAWHELSAQQRMQKLKDADLAGMIDTSRLLLLNTSGKGMIVVAGATPSVGQNMGTGKKTEALFIAQTRELDEICTKTGESFLASLQRDSNASQTEGSVPTALYDVLAQYGPAGFTEQKKPEKRSLSDKPAPEFEDQVKDLAKYGLPVFWRVREKSRSQSAAPGRGPVLSLTAMMRVPFKNSLKDIARRTQAQSDADPFDLVQGLLGWAPPDGGDQTLPNRPQQEQSLRSRVRFGFARSKETKWPLLEKKMIGAKPSASFWPYYLRPKTDTTHPVDYDNEHAIVAGRKRYPARHVGSSTYTRKLPTRASDRTAEDNQQDNDLTFLDSGITFEGEIRVRNVHPVEAGALLWAIGMGQRQGDDGPLRHMLGRAKAFGYGQIKAEITNGSLLDAVSGAPLDENTAIQQFEDWVVEGLRRDKGVEVEAYDELEPVRVLRGTAHPETGRAMNDVLGFTEVEFEKESYGGPKPVEGAERVLKSYAAIKTKAESKNAGKASASADGDGFIGLPPWPGYPAKD